MATRQTYTLRYIALNEKIVARIRNPITLRIAEAKVSKSSSQDFRIYMLLADEKFATWATVSNSCLEKFQEYQQSGNDFITSIIGKYIKLQDYSIFPFLPAQHERCDFLICLQKFALLEQPSSMRLNNKKYLYLSKDEKVKERLLLLWKRNQPVRKSKGKNIAKRSQIASGRFHDSSKEGRTFSQRSGKKFRKTASVGGRKLFGENDYDSKDERSNNKHLTEVRVRENFLNDKHGNNEMGEVYVLEMEDLRNPDSSWNDSLGLCDADDIYNGKHPPLVTSPATASPSIASPSLASPFSSSLREENTNEGLDHQYSSSRKTYNLGLRGLTEESSVSVGISPIQKIASNQDRDIVHSSLTHNLGKREKTRKTKNLHSSRKLVMENASHPDDPNRNLISATRDLTAVADEDPIVQSYDVEMAGTEKRKKIYEKWPNDKVEQSILHFWTKKNHLKKIDFSEKLKFLHTLYPKK